MNMTLSEIILNFEEYQDAEDSIHIIFAKKSADASDADSEALTVEVNTGIDIEVEDIAEANCPGYDYFLEMFIVRDMMQDLNRSKEYKSDIDKVKAIIRYAEFDA